MHSNENCSLALDHLQSTDPTPNVRSSSLLTTIPMISYSNPANSSIQSTRNKHRVDSNLEFHYVSTQKQAVAKEVSISYIVARLKKREYFLARL